MDYSLETVGPNPSDSTRTCHLSEPEGPRHTFQKPGLVGPFLLGQAKVQAAFCCSHLLGTGPWEQQQVGAVGFWHRSKSVLHSTKCKALRAQRKENITHIQMSWRSERLSAHRTTFHSFPNSPSPWLWIVLGVSAGGYGGSGYEGPAHMDFVHWQSHLLYSKKELAQILGRTSWSDGWLKTGTRHLGGGFQCRLESTLLEDLKSKLNVYLFAR